MRALISKTFYSDLGIGEEDIFVSDGAKCDITRLQVWFVLVWNIFCPCNLSILSIFELFYIIFFMLVIQLS